MSIYNYVTVACVGLLVILILVQTRGATLGAGLGSSGEIYTKRRGADLTLHRLTILVAIVFAASLTIGIITVKN